MATNPPVADVWQSQPSIIIDPSIYVADASSDPLRTRVLGALGTMICATAAGLVISVTVFAITLSNDWLVHGINHDERSVALNFAFGHDVTAPTARQATGSAPLPVPSSLNTPPAPVTPSVTAAPAFQAPLAPAPEAVAEDNTEAMVEIQTALREGRKQLQMRRYEEAERAFRGILARRPNHPGALSGMARIKLAGGELDPALGLARKAVSVAPSHGVYHAVLGDVLRASGEPAAADLEYDIASRLSQGSIDRVAQALPANPYSVRAQAAAVAQANVAVVESAEAAVVVEPETDAPGQTE
jgi:tetratricopeptide (TPR) repeat protein